MDTINRSTRTELKSTSKSLDWASRKPSLMEDEGPYFFVPTSDTARKKKRERFSLLDRFRNVSKISRPSTPSISDFLASVMTASPEEPSCKSSSACTFPRPGSAAQSFITRSRGALRRHGSKLSLSSFINDEDFGRRGSSISETCRRPSHFLPRDKQSSALGELISPPFGFRHVLHTEEKQFEKLERGSKDELINEFVAIRASQRPKEHLQGIHAENLPNDRTSIDLLRIPLSPAISDFSLNTDTTVSISGPLTPRTPCGMRSTTIENFSRPTPLSPAHKFAQEVLPLLPPPRTSSKNVLNRPSTAPAKSLGLPGNQNSTQRKTSSQTPGTDKATLKSPPLTTQPRSRPSLDSIRPAGWIGMRSSLSGGLHLRNVRSLSAMDTLMCSDATSPSNEAPHSQIRPGSALWNPSQWWACDTIESSNSPSQPGHINWSQQTVFLDGDGEDDAELSSRILNKDLKSAAEKQPLSSAAGKLRRQSLTRVFSSPELTKQYHSQQSPRFGNSAMDLEESLSPFGLHQSSSELRGYQHWSQLSMRNVAEVHIVSEEAESREHAYLTRAITVCDLDLPVQTYIPADRISPRGSSLQATRPLMTRKGSDASMWSNGESTVRTCQSSASIGSVPGLVYSRGGSRNASHESLSTEKSSAIESSQSSVRSTSRPLSRGTSTSTHGPIDIRGPPEDLPPLPALPDSVLATGEKRKKSIGAVPASPSKSQQNPRHYQSPSINSFEAKKHKPKATHTRRRTNSAAIASRSVSRRASYSLFPQPEQIREITT